MEIRFTQFHDFLNQVTDLINEICLAYGLNEPSIEFTAHMASVIKKHYGLLTIEQVKEAFELNSLGYLNDYLPNKGFSKDNKVSFTIPDMTKILKAYSAFKKLGKDEVKVERIPDTKELHEINNTWCDQLEAIFNKYMNDFERSHITLPWYTCDVLAKIGLLDRKKIDYTEKTINIRFKDARQNRRNNNENLIYQSFDAILDKGETLAKYLNAYRNRYVSSEVMPF